jgi:hypothetical protein
MKHLIFIIASCLLVLAGMQGCKKDFLSRPPLSAPTAGTFYKSDEEILEGTGPLYNAAWFPYAGTAEYAIGDVLGGNSLTDNYNGRGAYMTFTVPAADASLGGAYSAFWSVVANSNVVAYNIEHAQAGATPAGKNEGLAECRFMRGTAYMYLALDWGAVPIIYDNVNQIGDTSIRRNDLADVWKFIIMDLSWAKDHLPPTPVQPGRITKWSAEGMLGKAYLIASGLGQTGGQRNQSFLDSAKYYLGDVCNNSGLTLYPSYHDLFTSKVFSGSTVPSESLFSLLWVPSGGWFTQNNAQSNLAYSSLITQTGDGWGAAFGASASLLQYYMDPANEADSIRRKATYMMPGDFYPQIDQKDGGWHVDTALFNTGKIYSPGAPGNGWGTDVCYVKKYVIGSPADNGGIGGTQNENINTYMFRLAEVYLDYADAILGNNASTSDPGALKYYNAVRVRAGIAPRTSLTYADIFLEKKIEFALEGRAWYDWKQWYYFDPSDALNYYSTQDRGRYNISYNNGDPFVTFYNDATPLSAGVVNYHITSAIADLPIPEAELKTAPNLALPPVPFDFSKVKY